VELIDYEREREMIFQTFVEASRDVDLSFGFATADSLRSEVTLRCRALHYSGHGVPGALVFEDQAGGVAVLSPEQIRRITSGGDDASANSPAAPALAQAPALALARTSSLQLVFVSACHSESAGRAFVAAGVPHVVCLQLGAAIRDRHAQTFTRAFYLALLVGDSVARSFHIAKSSVDVAGDQSVSSKFLLLPAGADHDVSIFPSRRQVPFWPPPRALENGAMAGRGQPLQLEAQRRTLWKGGHCPAVSEDFLGRGLAAFEALSAVLQRRAVALTGIAGIGKTALAAGVASYATERHLFRDGCLFLRLEGVASVTHLLDRLCERTVGLEDAASSGGGGGGGSSSSPEGNSGDDLRAERLFEVLRARRFLLVLDHVDELIGSAKFRHFVASLLDETKGARVLLTVADPPQGHVLLPGYNVTVLAVPPLAARDAAQLFVRLCPHAQTLQLPQRIAEHQAQQQRQLQRHSAMQLPGLPAPLLAHGYDLLDALGNCKAMSATQAVPSYVCELAFAITLDDARTLVQQCALVVANVSHVTASP
jgi:hypothetical protein